MLLCSSLCAAVGRCTLSTHVLLHMYCCPVQDPELFELIATATTNSLSELSPHSLSDLISAFATTRDPQANKVRWECWPFADLPLLSLCVKGAAYSTVCTINHSGQFSGLARLACDVHLQAFT